MDIQLGYHQVNRVDNPVDNLLVCLVGNHLINLAQFLVLYHQDGLLDSLQRIRQDNQVVSRQDNQRGSQVDSQVVSRVDNPLDSLVPIQVENQQENPPDNPL